MSANIKREPPSMITRFALTLVGALLMIAVPYALDVFDLTGRLQITVLAGIEFVALAVGFVMLYLAFRGREPSS